MPIKRYRVNLSESEKTRLQKITTTGKASAKEIMHANILLATADNRVPKLTVGKTAEKCNVSASVVTDIRKRYAEAGLDAALQRKKRETPPVEPKITGEVEAHIIALACSELPDGFSQWSLRLLAQKAVELDYIESISHTSVRTVLKKRNSSHT
jgi:transposase